MATWIQFLVASMLFASTMSFQSGKIFPKNIFSSWISNIQESLPVTPRQFRKLNTIMSMAVDSPSTSNKRSDKNVDLSQYAVGNEYEGTVVNAPNFGVFVDIKAGVNVLLPRSKMTSAQFNKLKGLADTKSTEAIKIEIQEVSAANQTLLGKYLSVQGGTRDFSVLAGQDFSGKQFDATIISLHNFGMFAKVDDFGVEGLIPISKIPAMRKTADSTLELKDKFKPGDKVSVTVDEVNIEKKKMVLSMRTPGSSSNSEGGNDRDLSGLPLDKWMQGVIQSVTNFGIFVRPAGYSTTGLVYRNRIPRGLLNALRERANIASDNSTSEIEALFSAGDVVKIRVHSVASGSSKLEMTMLPAQEEEEDDQYVPEYVLLADEDDDDAENDFLAIDEDEDNKRFNPESTLLWWRGAPYTPSNRDNGDAEDEDLVVVNESENVVGGTWRRMLELDLREDQQDLSSKELEADLAEIESEISELGGVDEDIADAAGYGVPIRSRTLGSFFSLDSLPAEWRKELEFAKEKESTAAVIREKLRGGKKTEALELEAVLREVELSAPMEPAPIATNASE